MINKQSLIINDVIARRKKGSALIFTLVVIAVAGIVFTSLIQYVSGQLRYSQHTVKQEETLNIAEAGIHFYRWYIAHNVDGLTPAQVEAFWENTLPYPHGVNAPYEVDYEGIGKYRIEVTPPEPGSTSVVVKSTGWTYKDPALTRTIQVRLRRPAWCEYVIFSNSNIDVPNGTETFGKVHSNGGVRFQGVAHNIVSSAVPTYTYGAASKAGVWTSWANEYNTSMSNSVFLGGKDIGIGEEDFDGVIVNFNQMFTEAQSLGFSWGSAAQGHQIVLKGNVFDIFKMTGAAVNADGTVKDSKKQTVALNVPLPNVAVIYVGKNIWVEGTLGSGKRLTLSTIHSGTNKGNIYLSKDIRYANYTSHSVLGLAAEGNIEIVKGSSNNLHIDAVLLAQEGSVWRLDTSAKNSLEIYGAIAVNQDYGFNGYSTVNLTFDNSLIYYPPPFFPTKNEYVLDLWEEL